MADRREVSIPLELAEALLDMADDVFALDDSTDLRYWVTGNRLLDELHGSRLEVERSAGWAQLREQVELLKMGVAEETESTALVDALDAEVWSIPRPGNGPAVVGSGPLAMVGTDDYAQLADGLELQLPAGLDPADVEAVIRYYGGGHGA